MGTSLVNLHILNGDEQQIRTLLPTTTVGQWSTGFISVYLQKFEPRLNEKTARALSRKLVQPVLLAWIFDSDASGFTIYQSGKTVAEHIMNPDGYSKMGNIAFFCEILGLPVEDVPRLRAVWKKGGAEEQFQLTAMLLGLPLYHSCDMLPNMQHSRNNEAVDKWIVERPAPPKVKKVKSETKAILIQEQARFRWHSTPYITRCCSVEPYDDEYAYDKYQFWRPNADGTLLTDQSTEDYQCMIMSSQDRILGIGNGVIAFDSAGLLPKGYQTKGLLYYFMPDDGLLWRETSRDLTVMTYIRCAKDGSELWMKSEKNQSLDLWACENGEVIFASDSIKMCYLERVDELTGATVEKLPRPFGFNAWSKAYHNDCWWVAHDGNFLKDGKQENRGHTLTKADGTFQISAEIPLPTFSQELFFSPDDMYVYIFFYQNKVMVLDAETLATLNVLEDKSTLSPFAFDASGRFWLQRDRSTIEAWDAVLSKPLSRHRLKGEIMGHHKTEQGVMCVVTWSKKEKVLRVYKLD